MLSVIAEASSSDVNLLFLILALAAFAVAIYLVAARHAVVPAIVAAVIGVVILIFAF